LNSTGVARHHGPFCRYGANSGLSNCRKILPFYIWNNAPRFVEAEVDAYIARKIAERDDPSAQLHDLNVSSAGGNG